MNSLTLYQLAAEYREAAERLADLEMPPEVIADTLEGMAGTLEVKATNVAMFARNLDATADAIKAAEAEMAKRRKAIEARAEHMRNYLKMQMEHAGITKIEGPHLRLAIRNNPPAVEIVDAQSIPQTFMRIPEPPPPSPDKKAIAEALKAGQDVPGCRLTSGTRLEIK